MNGNEIMDVEVNQAMPDWEWCLSVSLSDCCSVCGKPLKELPFRWILFTDMYTSPTDYFVHPECSNELLSGSLFARN